MIRIWPVCIRCATRLLPEIPTSVSGPPAAAERPGSDRFACPVNNHPGRYGNGFRRIGERPYRVYRRCHEPLPARPRPAVRRYAGTPVPRSCRWNCSAVVFRDLFSAQPGWWRAHRPRRRVGGVHRAATLMGRLTAGPPPARPISYRTLSISPYGGPAARPHQRGIRRHPDPSRRGDVHEEEKWRDLVIMPTVLNREQFR